MFRLSGLLSIVLAVVCGTLLFWTSQSVQKAEQSLSKVSVQLSHEEESLRVLSAEWDYLNRPQRLEKLAQENFDLDEPSAKGVMAIEKVSAIPEPMVPVIPRMKPANLMQNVSTGGASEKQPPKTIQKTDRQDFDKLLGELSEEGAP